MEQDELTPDWLALRHRLTFALRKLRGGSDRLSDIRVAIFGPAALTALARRAGELRYALPKKSFYAVHAEPKLFFEPSDFSALIGDPDIIGLHISPKGRGGQPPIPGSLYAWAAAAVRGLSSPSAAGPARLSPDGLIYRNDRSPRFVLILAERPEASHDRPKQATIPSSKRLINTFTDWLRHRRELNEMRQLEHVRVRPHRGRLRVSPGDLNDWSVRGRMPRMNCRNCSRFSASTRKPSPASQPLVLRDMERVCALCASKGECDRDLAAGTSAEHYEGYCLNASTIELLDQQAGKKSAGAKVVTVSK